VKPFATLLLFLLSTASAGAQPLKDVVDEAKRLYYCERAAWVAADVVTATLPAEVSKIGGYITRIDGGRPTCVFYTATSPQTVVAQVWFDTLFTTNAAEISTTARPLSAEESFLCRLRTTTEATLRKNRLVKVYENTAFKIIPLAGPAGPRVYVMTVSSDPTEVLLGNDFLITFTARGAVEKLQRLHEKLTTITADIPYDVHHLIGLHSHASREAGCFTATDLCTYMLRADDLPFNSYEMRTGLRVFRWDNKARTLAVRELEVKSLSELPVNRTPAPPRIPVSPARLRGRW